MDLTHLDSQHNPRMVDVSAKPITSRLARAQAVVRLGDDIARQLADSPTTAKGNVLQVARLAGIQAAKRTSELIPLCHPLPLDSVAVEADLRDDSVYIFATVLAQARTGLEMEALTAVSVAALTVYDMCKALGRGIEITDVCLLEKSGGKSGHYHRD
ncbi:MAG: cyclic pyranopterin monophosphate synthase MoaC [Actinobacteria bacterium]|nr:cyclic pyranopterin monophosphate synthase MoaC [Actinomycetota bacterium]